MPKTSEPTLKRRHVETCRHYGKLSLDGGACRCPFYLDMRADGKRHRVALKLAAVRLPNDRCGRIFRRWTAATPCHHRRGL